MATLFTNTHTGHTGVVQQWTVPETGSYRITAVGAKGAGFWGGRGAKMSGVFDLVEGEDLKILVGQEGVSGFFQLNVSTRLHYYGGGGGTFVATLDNTPLIVAGGGGGGGNLDRRELRSDATITEEARIGTASIGRGGNVSGSDTRFTGGGGGFLGDGASLGGVRFIGGGEGGHSTLTNSTEGGFGGGGAARYAVANNFRHCGAGGGGGYTGGHGQVTQGTTDVTTLSGGGAGSYNAGTDQDNEEAIGESHGYVTIEKLNLGPEPTIREVVVSSFLNSITLSLTTQRKRVASASFYMSPIYSSAVLGVTQTSESVSYMKPIESSAKLASAIAVRHVETRAGPIVSSAEIATSRVTVTVTSKVTSIKTHAQRHIQRVSNVTTSVDSIGTDNVSSVVKTSVATNRVSAIHSDVHAFLLRARGHKIADLPLGTVIKDTNTRYNGRSIEWIVVSQNHPGAPTGATMLLARHALSFKPFSGAADGDKNSGTGVNRHGREDWQNSHMRQWLNRKTALNAGVTPEAVHHNPYHTEPGFMAGFGSRFESNLLATEVETHAAGTEGTYTTSDRVFFLSQAEAGLTADIEEGAPLPEDVHSLIRYAYPTQEAIDTDTSGVTRFTFEPTGWYFRTPDLFDGERRIRFYATNSFRDEWHGQLYPNFGSVAMRPAINMDGSIFVDEEPDENGVYTLIYDPIMPEIRNEVVRVTSYVSPITSKAFRETKEEFDISSYMQPLQSSSEAVTERAVTRVASSFMSPVTQGVTTETVQRVTVAVTSRVTSIMSSAVMSKKQSLEAVSYAAEIASNGSAARKASAHVNSHVSPIVQGNVRQAVAIASTHVAKIMTTVSVSKIKSVETVSYAKEIGSSAFGEKSTLERIANSYMRPITHHVTAEPSKRTTQVVTSQLTLITTSVVTEPVKRTTAVVASHMAPIASTAEVAVKRTAEGVSHVEKVYSSVTTETISSKSKTFVVTTVSKPIYSSNSRIVRANKDVTNYVANVTTTSTRVAERVTAVETHVKPIDSGSVSEAKREATVHSHVKAFHTYAVTRENDGQSVRTVASYVSRMHSSVVEARRGAIPLVTLSEVETNVKLSVEEARIVLHDSEITLTLTSNFK
ncbi:DUF6273 domain-containing protein [Alkalihalobacterium chitinilyticum]|uniref:receptor protein-tyrosine kinase n=1 Tax=Alkalihalobacterium chitinilyticum TaxID=2980103 RepID=A0ABT5VJK0_9BACI|nr:DUF6273 domain-containing protein [Alkalihalobacterium chitinilyticum]MDE5415487.1 glycine rich domain-containing protein [Alkalihalobacterium chitinilyticum]